MVKKAIILVGFIFLTVSFSAYAENNTIIVTATRTQVKIAQTPSKVDIITAKQLKKKGIIYVKNALKSILGISATSNGAFGGTTSVRMRGLPSYYTKILIDGVDVSDPSYSQPYYDLSNLMVNDIKRIEIVQGAQSGLYGSNAIGGVINIITKQGSGKPYFTYSQKIGSFNTYQETAQTGGQYKQLSFYVESSRFDTSGISKMDKRNPDGSYSKGKEKDSYHKTDFSFRIEYNFLPTLKIGTIFKWYKTRNYLDNGWTSSYPSYPNDSAASNNTPQAKSLRGINDFLMSKLYLNKRFNNLKLNISTFYMQNLRYYKSAPSYWNNYKGKRWGSNIIGTYKTGDSTITVGLTQQIEKYEDSSRFVKLRYNYACFAEIEQRISNLTLQGVAREDKYKTFGKHFTYKLGANYLIAQTDTILKANYSTGFRAPSIWELYAPSNPSWYFLGGNKNLKPEKAKTWDFGFIQNFLEGKLSFNALYFKNIVKNQIEYSTNPSTWQSTYENVIGKTVSNGFEVGVKAKPINNITLGANYTYTKSKNPHTNEQTARVPLRVYTGYVTVNVMNNKLVSTLYGRYIGKRFDDKYHVHQTGKYAVFDFATQYSLNKNLTASLSIKNIFNRFYEEVYGYSTIPRSVFATISYKF